MVGVILAGGTGSRMGGGKAARELAGRPLIAYPAAALQAVCERVAIVAKPRADLPQLEGVELWDDEPAEPRHPLTGIVHALEKADDRRACAFAWRRPCASRCRRRG
jgi:molybdopterin-guanine dinucleotide biosynthesis protein A